MILFLSTVTANRNDVSAQNIEKTAIVEVTAPLPIQASLKKAVVETDQLESYVRSYFSETPVLAEIAKCESRFRQFTSEGHVFRGKVVETDIGLMQINSYFHEKSAQELGFDIYTVDGNLEYAQWLYNREGTQPWSASSPCWDK